MQIKQDQIYKHCNNNFLYRVVCIAREEDLGVDFVVHQGLHDNRIWVRSVNNFLSHKDGKPRFTLVSIN